MRLWKEIAFLAYLQIWIDKEAQRRTETPTTVSVLPMMGYE